MLLGPPMFSLRSDKIQPVMESESDLQSVGELSQSGRTKKKVR